MHTPWHKVARTAVMIACEGRGWSPMWMIKRITSKLSLRDAPGRCNANWCNKGISRTCPINWYTPRWLNEVGWLNAAICQLIDFHQLTKWTRLLTKWRMLCWLTPTVNGLNMGVDQQTYGVCLSPFVSNWGWFADKSLFPLRTNPSSLC